MLCSRGDAGGDQQRSRLPDSKRRHRTPETGGGKNWSPSQVDRNRNGRRVIGLLRGWNCRSGQRNGRTDRGVRRIESGWITSRNGGRTKFKQCFGTIAPFGRADEGRDRERGGEASPE